MMKSISLRLADVKTTLECCSYQWFDFEDQAKQLSTWLNEKIAKCSEITGEKCSDLNDKKSQQKRAKVRHYLLKSRCVEMSQVIYKNDPPDLQLN